MARKQKRTPRGAARSIQGGAKAAVQTVDAFTDELTKGRSTDLRKSIAEKTRKGASKIRGGFREVLNQAKAKRVPLQNKISEKIENVRAKAPGVASRTKTSLGDAAQQAKSTVKQNVGSAASRANERLRAGTTSNTSTSRIKLDPATGRPVQPNVPRVKGSRFGQALRGGGRFASRALPPLAVGATALEGGMALGGAAIDTETGRNFLRQASGPIDEALGLTGGADVSGITGQDTLSNLNNPNQVVPGGTSGGFFSTDADSLNPGRSVADLDTAAGPAPRTLDAALTGNIATTPQEA